MSRGWLVASTAMALVGAARDARGDTLASEVWPVRVTFAPEHEPLASDVLAAAEKAWERQIIELGYPPPFTLGEPPELGMVFQIDATGLGPGAAVVQWVADVPSTPITDCSAVVVVDSATPAGSAGIYEAVFHELNHATQYATDCTEPPSAYEGFTVAAVRAEIADSTIVPWVVEQFQAFPEYPLDYWTMTFPCDGSVPCFPYQLGAALFPTFLMDRYGGGEPAFLADVFARFAQHGSTVIGPPHPHATTGNDPSWFEGVAEMLGEHDTSFADAFCEFSSWRAVVGDHDDGAHFSRGHEIAEPPISASVRLDDPPAPFAVYEYGSRYFEILHEPATAEDGWNLTISGDPEASWCASILEWRADGSVVRSLLPFAGATGSSSLSNHAETVRTVLVVSQLQDDSHIPDEMDYASLRSFTFRFDPVAPTPPDPEGETGPGAAPSSRTGATEAAGCGCTTVAAPARWGWAVVLLALGWTVTVRGVTRR